MKNSDNIIKLQARVDGSNQYANLFNNNIIQLRNSLESLIVAVNVSEKKIQILDIL